MFLVDRIMTMTTFIHIWIVGVLVTSISDSAVGDMSFLFNFAVGLAIFKALVNSDTSYRGMPLLLRDVMIWRRYCA